jgi:cytochrome o ubiquinol oxidase subunit 2
MRKHILNVGLFVMFGLLSSCGGIFSPVGLIAEEQKNLIIISFLLMLIVVVPVLVLTLIVVFKYRETKKKQADYKPEYCHSVALEIFWWGIPMAIIIVLATITWFTSHSLDPYKPLKHDEKPVKIQVVSLNWKWLFIYPEHNVATINYMPIPENVPINLELTSDAPMNSFWIPQIAGQIYTMTGMATKLHIIAYREGEYEGLSSNYSGLGFADMKFKVKVMSNDDFEAWIKEAKVAKKVLNQQEYEKLIADSKNNPVEYYSSVKSNLFSDIMMKYMDHSVHGGAMEHDGHNN